MKTMAKITSVALLMASCPLYGCMAFVPSPMQRGSIVLAGDADGVESFLDGLNGLVASGNTQDPTGDNAHWQHRKHQEEQRTRRHCKNCGFVQKLTGTDK